MTTAAPTPLSAALAPATTPTSLTTMVVAFAPAASGVPAGLQLAVMGGGVRMPLVQVVEAQPEEAPPIEAPRAVAAAPVAPPYVAPYYPPKQDRN